MLTPDAGSALQLGPWPKKGTRNTCARSVALPHAVFIQVFCLSAPPLTPSQSESPSNPHVQCGASRPKPRPASTCSRGSGHFAMLGHLRLFAESWASPPLLWVLEGMATWVPDAEPSVYPVSARSRDHPIWGRHLLHVRPPPCPLWDYLAFTAEADFVAPISPPWAGAGCPVPSLAPLQGPDLAPFSRSSASRAHHRRKPRQLGCPSPAQGPCHGLWLHLVAQSVTSEALTGWGEGGGGWYAGDTWTRPGDSGVSPKWPFSASAHPLPPLPRGGRGAAGGSCQAQMPLQSPLPPEGFGDLTSKDSQRNWCPCPPSLGWP